MEPEFIQMPRRLRVSIALFVVLAAIWQTPAVRAQTASPAATGKSAKTWIGQTARIEQELKTAEVIRIEDIGTGVTRPRRAYLKPGGLVESLTWKVLPPAYRHGYWESYKSEIAAYELDKLLALNMVPPAVEREIEGSVGAAIMWVSPTTSVKQMGGKVPTDRIGGEEIRRMQLFDNFIGNSDRNAGNILVDGANEVILIDHSRAFIESKELPAKFERVDADVWAAIQALSVDALRTHLAPLIGDRAIDAMIERRDRMRAAIDALVAKHGRARVIIEARPRRTSH
jgi:hypothetical protein